MSARQGCPAPERLLLRRLGTEQTDEVTPHLAECMACRTSDQELERALAPWALACDPLRLRAELRDRLDARPPPPTPPQVRLRCVWCHDTLQADEAAAHCGDCLAPHHGECRDEHGRCAAPGCGSLRVLRPLESLPVGQATPPSRWRVLALGLALGVLTGGVAARLLDRPPPPLVAARGPRHDPPPRPAQARIQPEAWLRGLARLARCGVEWKPLPGAPRVLAVRPGSPAARAWLEPRAEVLSLDGAPTPDLPALIAALGQASSPRVVLRVVRSGVRRDVLLELPPPGLSAAAAPRSP